MLQFRHNSRPRKGSAGMRDTGWDLECPAKSGTFGNPTLNWFIVDGFDVRIL
jgi:hypothetical protein